MKIKNIHIRKIGRYDSIPDIDLDFESKHRSEVKRYLEFKYGKDFVCSIGAYGRMKVKSGVKDFAKIKGIAFSDMNYVTSFMDEQLQWLWEDIFKYALQSKVVYEFVQKNPEIINVLNYGLNQATNESVHASAVIIVPKFDHEGTPMTIYEWLPVKKMKGQDGEPIIVSQWEGKYTDRGGYLKEDILGLDQLDKFHRVKEIILEQLGQDVILEDIPFDDRSVYKAFGKGYVEDVFQFGSDGLRSYSIRSKPADIEHLIAMNALYRPGPMSSNAHTDFADILNGKKEPVYDYMLKEVTEPTLGLYVYQEQIMKAVVVLGGLSLVEADNFRTAIKKFDKAKMAAYQEKFISGAIERGCPEDEAKSIWSKLLRFSGYGFNKCLSGDTMITTDTGSIMLSELYKMSSNGKKFNLLSFDGVDFFIQELVEVFDNGIQELYEIELENGNKIKVTENHKMLTSNGYKTVLEMTELDEIICYEKLRN